MVGFYATPPDQMNSMVLRTYLGLVITNLSQTFHFHVIQRDFQIFGEIGAGPWSLPVALPISLGGCSLLFGVYDRFLRGLQGIPMATDSQT